MNTRINLPAVLAYLKQADLIAAVEISDFDETYRRSVCKLRCRLLPSKYQVNEPHFPKLASFPHHFHDHTGTAFESPLSGDVFADLDIVLAAIPTIISELELTA